MLKVSHFPSYDPRAQRVPDDHGMLSTAYKRRSLSRYVRCLSLFSFETGTPFTAYHMERAILFPVAGYMLLLIAFDLPRQKILRFTIINKIKCILFNLKFFYVF